MATPPTPPRIVIIGGGFSGSLTAVHLLRAGAEVTLIERRATPGPGLAYSTTCAAHLLNVPAGRMSAFPDDPNHLLNWATQILKRAVAATEFLPRALYGRYIRDILSEAASHHASAFRSITADAIDVRDDPRTGGITVDLAPGSSIGADAAVLALGNPPPSDPPVKEGASFYESNRYVRDPWAAGAFDALDPRAPVLLLGAGLTMLDVVLALVESGHTGTITAISRRGLLPRWHAPSPAPPHDTMPFAPGASPREALRAIRAAAGAHTDWRPIVDALRPINPAIWARWSHHQRAAFLRHLRPHWDVHRHRAAASIGARIDRLIAAGKLRIMGGRTVAWSTNPGGATATIHPRGAHAPITMDFARVYNCTGPTQNIARVNDPLVRALLSRGTLCPDPLSIGALCDAEGCPLDRAGNPHRLIRVVGAWRTPQLWESIAVPELRVQAAEVAASVVATAGRPPGITPSSR